MACWQGLRDKKCKRVKSKMADGRHFESRHISVKNRPILIKFGTHHTLNLVTVTWPKIAIFKIQHGGGRHLEIRFFGHNSSTDCPISTKFCMRKQNGMLTKATGQKMQMCKIQDGGRPPFWKSLNRHICQWKIEPSYSHVTKKWMFWNSRWRQPPSWNSLF